jgi:aspartyl-tRNA(Asn)/glutamyl-tRNA(Gln) amidotransferase subunit A
MTLGYAKVQKEVMGKVEEAVKAFEEAGHQVELWGGSLPDVSNTWTTLTNCELYGMLHRSLARNRKEMGRTLVESIEQAKNFSFKHQIDAQKARTDLNRRLWQLFEEFDLLVTPAMPTEAFGAKGPPPAEIDGEAIPLLGVTPFTYPFNLSGHPAASVRAGFTGTGLPLGLQIIGPHHRDDRVLQMAYLYEQMRPWNDRWPEIG